jgi:hypothetical protein
MDGTTQNADCIYCIIPNSGNRGLSLYLDHYFIIHPHCLGHAYVRIYEQNRLCLLAAYLTKSQSPTITTIIRHQAQLYCYKAVSLKLGFNQNVR